MKLKIDKCVIQNGYTCDGSLYCKLTLAHPPSMVVQVTTFRDGNLLNTL
jgi:hypothetical protein